MALGEYQAALKLGRRQYQEAVLMGKSPYLPVLDEILEGKDIVAEVSLGVMDIPLDKIVGTKTTGRTTAFSNQFMPLLPESRSLGQSGPCFMIIRSKKGSMIRSLHMNI